MDNARKAVEQFKRLVATNSLSEYTLGAILGFEITPQEIDEAEERAIAILHHLDMLPAKTDIVFCEKPLVDRNGNPVLDGNGDPELCGHQFTVSSEPSRGRTAFRWECKGVHNMTVQRRRGNVSKKNPDRTHRLVRINPLKGYTFKSARIEYRKFLKILFGVFMDRGVNEMAALVGGSKTTASHYTSLIKEALAVSGWHDQRRIGGPGDVVEVDEVRLVIRKNNRGRIPVGQYWVFGGVSHATKKRFAMRVDYRDRATLHAEIMDSIAPGSIICSDGWAAYEGIMPTARANNLNLPGLRDAQGNMLYRDHLVVIHQTNFVEPPRHMPPLWRNDILPECRDLQHVGRLPANLQLGTNMPFRVHTQTVERQWRELRDSVESSQDLDDIDRKIGYWLYRENTLRRYTGTLTEKFLLFVSDMARLYTSQNIKPITANRPGARLYPNQQQVPICECDECA